MPYAAVAAAVKGSNALHELGFAAAEVYRSMGMENTQANKFIVMRWGDTNVGVGSSNPVFLTVWAYDMPGSYVDIDRALGIIKDILSAMVEVEGNEGWVTQIKWLGFSGDLYDDMMKRITKNAIFTVNTRAS